MGIIVKIKGNRQLADQQLKLIHNLAEKQLRECAELTVQVMRFHIQTSIERANSTGRLAKGIFASKIFNGWGVGDIDYLNEKVPYWVWINYGIAASGRRIPPGTDSNPNIKGKFSPKNRGRFVKGFFPIYPEKPITPHNYIEHTVQQIP